MNDDWGRYIERATDYALIVVSDSAEIEAWSKGAESIFGWTPDEMIGEPFAKIFTKPDRDLGAPQNELDQARRHRISEDSRWHLRADATSVYVNGVTRWLPDEQVYIKIVRDVTRHPRTERRTEAFLDASGVVAAADDPAPALQTILERLAEDLLWDAAALWTRDQTITWQRRGLETDMLPALEQASLDAPPLSTCLTTPGIEWRTNLHDRPKSRFTESLREAGIRTMLLVPFRSQVRSEGILGFFSKEIRPPDRHIVKMMSNLGALIERLYERIATMNVLRNSLTLRDELIATISHDLRSPLTTIRGWSEIMKDASRDERNEAASRIEHAVRQQEELLEDLLAATKTSDGRLEIRRERIDLEALLSELIRMGQVQISEKNLQVTTVFPEEDCIAEIDPRRVRQVAWNLLSNAMKFTRQNGSIELRLTCTDDLVSISVSDDGRGMTGQEMENIFGRFWSQDESGRGTGLGLYVARNLVEAHGGAIRAESEGLGKGSTFTVDLPRYQRDPGETRPEDHTMS